uniref:Uncharacterized protein n=1 Tax=Gopherus agassizii TaxID=38772 RepID=A0A452IAQ2_9SAUR
MATFSCPQHPLWNYLHRLPEEMRTLLHLKVINLSRNKFRHFPEQLTTLKTLETINLEENEITEPTPQSELSPPTTPSNLCPSPELLQHPKPIIPNPSENPHPPTP